MPLVDARDEHIANLTPEPIILQLIAVLDEPVVRFQWQPAVKSHVPLAAV
jgi:hypothetical protein